MKKDAKGNQKLIEFFKAFEEVLDCQTHGLADIQTTIKKNMTEEEAHEARQMLATIILSSILAKKEVRHLIDALCEKYN